MKAKADVGLRGFMPQSITLPRGSRIPLSKLVGTQHISTGKSPVSCVTAFIEQRRPA